MTEQSMIEFLGTLRGLDVRLWSDGNQLRVSAPDGTLTPELQAELKKRKADILAFLDSARGAAQATSAIQPAAREGDYPLSYTQQQLWFLDQLDPENAAYNIPVVVRMAGPLNRIILKKSINAVIRRHESLRTTFQNVDGRPRQVIAPTLEVVLPVTDLSALPLMERENEVIRLANEGVRRPFDLSRGPLMRCGLLSLSDEQHVLLLSLHHIISDGWSMGILFREILLLYQATAEGRPAPLAELPLQYVDYAVWQREWLQGEILETQMNYWKKQLEKAPTALDLPTDYPRPAAQTHRGAQLAVTLPRELSDGLQALGRQEDVTLFMILLAAFQALLSCYSGQADISIGSPVANRNRNEWEGLIGFFANTLVLRTDLSGNPSLRELLPGVRAACLGAYNHQDIPFEKLVDEIQVARDLSRNPLFQAMFILQNTPFEHIELAGLHIEPLEIQPETAQFDLRMSLQETPTGLRGFFEYSTDLFEQETIVLLLDLYRQILAGWVQDPEQRLAQIHLPAALAARVTSARVRDRKQTIAISASFTAEPVEDALAFWMQELDLPSILTFAPYNQVFQQLLDPASLFSRNEYGINVILIRFEDWLREAQSGDPRELLERNLADLENAVLSVVPRMPCLIVFCPASPAELSLDGRAEMYLEMEQRLHKELAVIGNIHIVLSAELESSYPVQEYYDAYTDVHGHLPYTPAMYSAIASVIARRLYAIRSAPHKVIVLDCDQTLWQGISGEEGVAGVTISPPYQALQKFMVAQLNAGMLLCLCSKNEEADVWAVFENHAGMELKREQLVSWRINWQPKSENLKSLADELGLGLDSFIFVDDNPVECAEVRAYCPDVLTLQLPQDSELIPRFLKHVWAFDHMRVTGEDKQRTQLYQQNSARERFRAETLTFQEFLAGLELKVEILEMTAPDLARVAQLTERTNQFNFTTLRRTESEILDLCLTGKKTCMIVQVSDRFGEYGLVGVLLFGKSPTSIVVDTFLLSCRVLGRGVEHFMLAKLGQLAQSSGLAYVEVAYMATAKNRPALDFLQSGEQFAETQGEALLFRFPAPWAAESSSRFYSVEAAQAGDRTSGQPVVSMPGVVTGRMGIERLNMIARELSTSGDILKAVQKQEHRRLKPKSVFVAPGTPLERTLVEIWKEILKIEPIGIHDNFFELGGHSLLATQVVSRIRQACKAEVSLHTLFQAPTVAGLAQVIWAAEQIETSILVPVARPAQIPLSFAQQRLWFVDRMQPGNSAYNIFNAVRLLGPLDVTALEQGLKQIVQRHETLRTSFQMVDGQPYQVIASSLAMSLPLSDLSALSPTERETEVERLARAEAQRPFDLASGPLVRCSLLRLAVDEHILLLGMHHIISDGWSMGVLFKEIVVLAQAYAAGQPELLPALTLQYADFAIWQREWLQGEVLDAQLSYWKKQLEGAPAALEITGDHPRPAVQTFQGARLQAQLPKELTEALQALSRREGVTLYMLLLAAFKVLLMRYSGQNDILVGSPVANRKRSELEGLIGFFVNTLVLRTDLSGNPGFRDVLQRVRETCLGAYDHQDLPFEKLVDELRVTRDLSRNPLFQVMFVLQNTPLNIPELGSLRAEGVEIEPGSAQFDLSMFLQESGDGLSCLLEYNTDLFEAETISRMLGHFRMLLDGIVADPGQRVSDLPLLSAVERQQIVTAWNDTQVAYGQDKCMHELFEAQVEKTPDAVAVVFAERQLSYRELNEYANQLAHYLQKRGVGPDVLVGVCMQRSLEMMIGLLGILKAGGAYVPLDPAYPKERLAYMLEDARVSVLLTQAALLEELPGDRAQTICLDSAWERIMGEPSENLTIHSRPENLAYVIYTSGSTGKPKGAMIVHSGLVNYLMWCKRAYPLDQGQGAPVHSSISFDLTITGLFAPLIAGLPVHMLAENISTETLSAALKNVTDFSLIKITPAHLQLFGEQLSSDQARGCTRAFIIGGENLQPNHVNSWRTNAPETLLVNEYGPTETVVGCCVYVVQAGDHFDGAIPIGRPINNTQLYILDAQLQPTPIGVAGELHIAGAGLGRGYLNRPDLTADKFIPDPFSRVPGVRMYKSGDLARYLPDGNIECLGRIDHQVKIRGFRIELGEIEAVLAALPEVGDVVVLAREDVAGDKYLVAYLVMQAGQSLPERAELRIKLLQNLPDHMLPAHFIALERLPLTPNGKVDRKALPAPDMTRSEAGYVAPRTPTEEILASIWAEALKLDKVGIHDNFFELGGHSLLAVALVERMRGLGLRADIRSLFATPTIAALATAVNSGSDEVDVPPNRIPAGCEAITADMLPLAQLTADEIAQIVKSVPGGAANIQDIYPLAPLQEGILFHHRVNSTGDVYLLPTLLGFDSRERLERFVGALQSVINRHDILRTAVLWDATAEPVQVVWRQAAFVVEEVRLSLGDGDIAQQLSARYDQRHYRLDVREAPMVRGFIAEDRANGRWLLQILFHHLVSDHTTLELVIAEIQAILQNREGDLPRALPFRNFVAQTKLGISRAEHEAFFTDMLSRVDEPTVPFGLLDVQGDGSGIEEARREVDPRLAERLRRQARGLGVSAASLMHLAWAQVLSRLTGRQDVVFGTVLFGRMQAGEGADRVLGMFINTLPIRIPVGEQGVGESVRQTHASLTQLLRHEHASLALAQRCSGVMAPAPLFSALLNYRHSSIAQADRAPDGLQAWEGMQMLGGQERSNYPVALSIDDLGNGFSLTAQIVAGVRAQRICDYMSCALEHLVQALESAPQTAANRIEVLPAAEREQLVLEWNDTATKRPKTAMIHELFAAQARRTPKAMAVIFKGQQLTYHELNQRSNRLAHYLRSKGVGPDAFVGLCVERSLEMIVGLLGILKAGGAYLPLDPAYPKDRLAFMLEDANPALLLTQQHLHPMLPASAISTFCLDTDWETLADFSAANPDNSAQPGNLAYVIYTSGSTGRPKGVLLDHKGLSNLVHAQVGAFSIHTAQRVLQFASLNFDASTSEIFMALLSGATLCLAERDDLIPGEMLDNTLQQLAINVVTLPPVALNLLSASALPKLETVIVAGEACPAALATQWTNAHDLFNAYGPTEATVCASIHRCHAEQAGPPPIGRPIANTQIYLLDANLNPVPVGVAGELYIAGDGLARGYLNRPDLTAEKFVPNPFGGVPGVRMYQSGDLARYLPDGNIEFLGRSDNQVKIRGFRIEPGEIEMVLAGLTEVREAVVLAREDTPGQKRLAAYLVLQEGHNLPDTAALRSRLLQSLPDYMIPAHFIQMEQLPLTPSGKIDRRALPSPSGMWTGAGNREYVAARTPMEDVLVQIGQDILKVERIGVNDNFFELGGDSLLAAQFVSRVRSACQVELPFRVVFRMSSIAEIAEYLEETQLVQQLQASFAAGKSDQEVGEV